MNERRLAVVLFVNVPLLLFAACQLEVRPESRTVTIETREVTSPDVAVSPDGRTLVFTLLGHLFRIDAEGGAAEQLTFGPFYDEDPAFSPDGRRIAFASDRGGGEANLFVLALDTGVLRQVTDGFWAARPVWAPDSESLLYLSYEMGNVNCSSHADVRRVTLDGSAPQRLADSRRSIRAVGFMPDGRPTWVRQESTGDGARSVIEEIRNDGAVAVVATVDGEVDRLEVGSDGSRWLQRSRPWRARGELLRIVGEEAPVAVADVTRHSCRNREPRFGVGPRGDSVFLGEEGQLWRYLAETGVRDSIPFVARAEFTLPPKTDIPQVDPTEPGAVIEISYPQRWAAGEGLVFSALGKVWSQEDEQSQAKALTPPGRIDRRPALSPDGGRVAVIDATASRHEVVVIDLLDGRRNSLLEGDYFWDLTWEPGGTALAVSQGTAGAGATFTVLSVDVATGQTATIVERTGAFAPPRAHYSEDGRRLFYTSYEDGAAHVYSFGVTSPDDPDRRLHARLPFYLSNIQTSPQLDWLGFRRNSELWVAPLGRDAAEVSEQSSVKISDTGGRDFVFSGVGTVIYAEGGSVWEYDLPTRTRHQIAVNLVAGSAEAPPVLIDRVRLLDFEAGGFTEETAILVRHGRIERTGSEVTMDPPPGVQRVDAEGRFAIPGLIEPHAHSEAPWWGIGVDQRAFLAHGITTVRDVGEPLHWVKPLAQRSALTGDALPRYLFAGDYLYTEAFQAEPGNLGVAHSVMLVYDEETTRQSVRELSARGAHAVKAYASLPMNLHRVAADEARALGLPVVAHGSSVKEVVRLTGLGYRFGEHLGSTSRFHDDVYQLLAAAGTYWTPTASVMGGMMVLSLPPAVMETDRGRFFEFLHETELRDLAGARERSVEVLIATDNPLPGAVGSSYHQEMQAFALAGFSPLEVLDIATRRTAAALGLGGSLGTLEPGKLADLVILDQNPLDDITRTRGIWRVVKAGRVFDPARLSNDGSE
jgi:imidazolonepropionase-like amidohydrolase/Tol biopolymer transport system component